MEKTKRQSPHLTWIKIWLLSYAGLNVERNVERIVLFDDVCVLCSGWARFLIRHDRDERFKLASVQSPMGQALLRRYGFPTDRFGTMVYLENGEVYTRSAAALQIIAQLGRPWSWLRWLRLVPRSLRDRLYNLIARNRYRLFGQRSRCYIPSVTERQRFLPHGFGE